MPHILPGHGTYLWFPGPLLGVVCDLRPLVGGLWGGLSSWQATRTAVPSSAQLPQATDVKSLVSTSARAECPCPPASPAPSPRLLAKCAARPALRAGRTCTAGLTRCTPCSPPACRKARRTSWGSLNGRPPRPLSLPQRNQIRLDIGAAAHADQRRHNCSRSRQRGESKRNAACRMPSCSQTCSG